MSDLTPPRLCLRCRLRPSKYPEGGICLRCSQGRPPLALEGFDPATALPPVELDNALNAAKALRATAKEARAEARRLATSAGMGRTTLAPPAVPAAAARFTPYPEGPPAAAPTWWVPYLVQLATLGGRTRAAYDVGVKPRDVKRLLAHRADLAEDEQDAIQWFADGLAVDLPNSKTPIGRIARLKSIRPTEYETALIVQNVTNNTLVAAPAAAETLMQEWLATLDPPRAAMLRGEVIDVPADVIVEATDEMLA